jgi:hypothetical protein
VPRTTLIFLLSAVSLLACRGGPDEQPPMDEEPPMTQPEPAPIAPSIDYEGPPVEALLEVMESEPPQHALAVAVEVPTAGWELEVDGLRRDGAVTVLELKLTEPGAEELVAQVLQTKTVRVPLDERPQVFEIRVSRWRRGVEYFVAPPAKLALRADG